MSLDAEYLFSLLPAFYRERDAEAGGTLRALLNVIAGQGALLEADIAGLYDNWFIETCQEWLIPYIGDLLGVRGLYGVEGTQAFGQRGLVANTLRMRRRKGTVPVLEQLAFDSTGWRARAVEFFQLLEASQQVNHRRLDCLRTPDLRDAAQLERIDGPFDRASHTLEVRALPAGRYNIANIGLYLWRIQAYALQRSSARAVTTRAGLFSFDPLGRDLPLFNRPRTETDISHLAEPINVPEPLSRRLLHDDLTALRQAISDGSPLARRYFPPEPGSATAQAGLDPVARIWVDGREVPGENLLVCNLSPLPNVNPEEWRRPPTSLTVAASRTGQPATTFPRNPADMLVGFDPLLGRIALPAGVSAQLVEVAFAYGFPGDVGGGPYDRRPQRREEDAGLGLLKPPDFDAMIQVPGDQPTLAAALALVTSGKRWLIRLDSDSTEVIAPDLNLPDTQLAIEAVNRRRPVLVGDFRLRGNSDTRLNLSGLLLDGQLKLQGALRRVDIRHCSLVPERGGIRHGGSAAELELLLTHAVCGPIRVSKAIAALNVNFSIIDGGQAVAIDLPDSELSIDRSTVFGSTRAGQLQAGNSIFTARLAIERRQEGCVRFCYVPPKSETPRRYRCQPDLAALGLPAAKAKAEMVRVTPGFTSTTFGNAAYAQLRLSTAQELRTGAEDGAEMGVWNLLKQPQREANLRQALDEYVRFGLEAGVIFVN